MLQLGHKGALAAGKAADAVVLDRADLEVREVISKGRRLVVDGRMEVREKFLEGSDRQLTLTGDEHEPGHVPSFG